MESKKACDGCHAVFETKRKLEEHKGTCERFLEQKRKKRKNSFYNVWLNDDTSVTRDEELDKMLPLSQPLSQPLSSDDQSASKVIKEKINCEYCSKSIMEKGMKKYLSACKIKKSIDLEDQQKAQKPSDKSRTNIQIDDSRNQILETQLLDMENEQQSNHTQTRELTAQDQSEVVNNERSDINQICALCKSMVGEQDNGLECKQCHTWFHQKCLYMTDEEFLNQKNSIDKWLCSRCCMIKSNKIKWGDIVGEENIRAKINHVYSSIIGWRKNAFQIPRGQCATDFIKELTRLINLFNTKSKWERIALPLLHIFVPIMLQKPSKKSKPRDHVKYLKSRLTKWSNGEIDVLMEEANEIQKRLKSDQNHANHKKMEKDAHDHKRFTQLMMLGRIGEAAKLINNEDSIIGVHTLNEEIKAILQQKHPEGKDADPDILLQETNDTPQPVVYERISVDLVQKTAKNLRGSGGPTLVDSESWRHFLCSKWLGKATVDLSQAVADLAKILCTEDINPDCLTEYVACRLVPLDKGLTKEGNPGVRPVGVGEVLRRLIGKLLLHVIKDDVMTAAGPLQTCTGIKGGIEAAIHSMREVYEDENTEAVLLVDAENAFNKLNRKAAIHNIQQICPTFHRYLHNTYQKPAMLIIPGNDSYEVIHSEEGTTQGDVAAMAEYGLGVKPLIDRLSNTVDSDQCKHVWYADDSTSGGKLSEVKKWWDELCNNGPKYGYHPLASKTILIVKAEYLQRAQDIFGECGVKITTEGERHMGAVIGSIDYKEEFLPQKVTSYC